MWRFTNSWNFEITNVGRFNASFNQGTNRPYFFIASGDYQLGVNFLQLDLLTGSIQYESQSGSTWTPNLGVTFANDFGLEICGDNSGLATLNGGLAAGAHISKSFLTAQQMVKWAQDPWALWYDKSTLPTMGTFSMHPDGDIYSGDWTKG